MCIKKELICTKIDRYGDRYSEKSQPVPYTFLWEYWAVATEGYHDIEYIFENISETQTKITPIYKGRGPDNVGEPTYETRKQMREIEVNMLFTAMICMTSIVDL